MKKKRQFVFPSAMVTLLIILVLVSLLTYVLPAGKFTSHIDPESGTEIVGLEDFAYVESDPVNPLELPLLVVKTFSSESTVNDHHYLSVYWRCVNILTSCGALQALADAVIQKLKGRRFPVLCLYFLNLHFHGSRFDTACVCCVRSLQHRALRTLLDMMPSWVSHCLCWAALFPTAPGALMATTVTAQSLLGLSPYSGLAYRLVCTACLAIPTLMYVYIYGERVRSQKRESIVPDYVYESTQFSKSGLVDRRHFSAMLLFVLTIVIIVFGSSRFGWTTIELSAAFLVCGIAIGLLYDHNLETVVSKYIKGAQNMLPGAAVAGVASAIAVILSNSGVMDTVVYFASRAILSAGDQFKSVALFIAQSLVSVVIVSGSGQIAATMPIVGPIAQICGIPRANNCPMYYFG